MTDITVIILTKNEEKNLPDCLESISSFAKRVVVIDSGSDDDTVEIAENSNCDVYIHPFENYAKQFNWGLDNTDITTKWTLRLDADERLTPELCAELERLTKKYETDDNINGITMEAWLYFMGKRITYGGPKKRKLMLFKTGVGRIEDRQMDEHTILSYGESVAAKEKFLHFDYKDLTFFIDKLNWYASREVLDYFDYLEKKDKFELDDEVISSIRRKKYGVYYRFPKFIRSWLLFVYFYVFRLGFLDGKEGFVYHYMYQRWYRCLVDAKILEKEKEKKNN